MIADVLQNSASYAALSARLAEAFEWLRTQNLEELPDGQIEIDGDDLFAIVQEYETVPPDGRQFEAHRRFADIQYIVSGMERILAAPTGSLSEDTEYDEAKDVVFYASARAAERASADLTLKAGTFALLLPQDAHMPMLRAGPATAVRKIVVKVGMET